jgi:hypothetical protein
MIKILWVRFQQSGAVLDLPRSGRPRTARNQEILVRVNQSINENPKTSIRRRSIKLGLNRSSLHRILKRDLHLFGYKIQMVHAISPNDFIQRLNYSRNIQRLADEIANLFIR